MSSKHKKAVRQCHDESVLDDNLLALARSINEIFNQSYALLKPVVDDVCRHPQSFDEDELAHLFDAVMDVVTDKGMRLFGKLCKTFSSIYPDCVRDYIRIQRELYGEDSGPSCERNV